LDEESAVQDFEYTSLPARVVFGPGSAREKLAPAVDSLKAQRVLVIAAPGEEELARELVAPFAERVGEFFTDVRPHVPVFIADRARAAARRSRGDMILSVGGGSTTGTAKAVALTTGLRIVAIPTTYAGSEATPVWGLTGEGRKQTGTDPRVLPRIVIYDPELTVTLPGKLSAASGLNALAHCVEALWTPRSNPITSLLAEEGMRALSSGLPGVLDNPNEIEARSLVLYGAWLAGSAFAVAGSGLHHKLVHVLGGAYDLPHAELHAVLLPYVTTLLAPAIPGLDARVSAVLGAGDGVPAAAALVNLARRLGAPTSLREIGLPEGAIADVAALAAEHAPQYPRAVLAADLAVLLDAAWRGDALQTV
jgi:alcohol dehydrogenase class IV